MSSVQIGIVGTPAAVGDANITTTINFTGLAILGTSPMGLQKENGQSPINVQTIVSTGANQNFTYPAGATGLVIVPPINSSANTFVPLTALSANWGIGVAPINPLAYSDITFDPNFLPTTIVFNGTPANCPLTLICY